MQKGFSLVIVLIILVILAGLVYGGYSYFQQQKIKGINSFEECGKYYPIMESYPAQCNTPDGRHFVQELSEEEKQKLVPPDQGDNEVYEGDGFSFTYPSRYRIKSQNESTVEWEGQYTGNNWYSIMFLNGWESPYPEMKQNEEIVVNRLGESYSLHLLELSEYSKIIDGKEVKRYSFSCAVDCAYDMIRFESNGNYYQLIHDVAGGGLGGTFQTIIDSLNFSK